MNKIRRNKLKEAVDMINKARNIIEIVLNDEDMAFNNLSEGLQQTMRGETMENNISEMEEAIDNLDEVLEKIDEILCNLDNVE